MRLFLADCSSVGRLVVHSIKRSVVRLSSAASEVRGGEAGSTVRVHLLKSSGVRQTAAARAASRAGACGAAAGRATLVFGGGVASKPRSFGVAVELSTGPLS